MLRGHGTSEGFYRVKPALLAAVEFRKVNLIEPLQVHESFPVIFCRNVMIYFDRATQAGVVQRLASCLEPGGFLFVGHAESLTGIPHGLEYIQPAVYRKPGRKAV
jgi:chemotaxis protein methyltransferase CheR